ncbi:MarR family winged helix-turn-helix transcriptional regulator [Natronoglycomyces albus]|uniref:MarR family transcriptional regulator n=1 Tax=Natronoglycomyces albus TaxID=2811108 RepID=A0A895XW89_9ACTN|nr:MarR family transcriptional regulator [Natronoglycomyces albus]QSB06796.1 MarR family transcriptional regulator [Natronoglycomyces albus]
MADITAAWQREKPGMPTDSIAILTPITRLAKLLNDDRARLLRRAGIDSATLDLLSVLRRSGPPYVLTTRDISARSLVTAGAISQRLSRAEKDGLIRRAPSPTGRRAVAVTLTDKGHSLVDDVVEDLLTHESHLIGDLTDPEREALKTLLDKLATSLQRHLSEIGEDSPPA